MAMISRTGRPTGADSQTPDQPGYDQGAPGSQTNRRRGGQASLQHSAAARERRTPGAAVDARPVVGELVEEVHGRVGQDDPDATQPEPEPAHRFHPSRRRSADGDEEDGQDQERGTHLGSPDGGQRRLAG